MNFPFATASDDPYPQSSGSIRIGRWCVCTSSGEIRDLKRRRQPRRLEPTPLRLLQNMAARPGQVLSRDALTAATWPQRFISPDSLNTAIHQIRTALDDDARQPRILQTVPGIGYRLIAEVEELAGPKPQHLERLPPTKIPFTAAAAIGLMAIGLVIITNLEDSKTDVPVVVLAPTLAFPEDAPSGKVHQALERQLEGMAATIKRRLGAIDGPALVIESSIHENRGHHEVFVHALSTGRDQVLLTRRIRLSDDPSKPISDDQMRTLKLALSAIVTPSPHTSLAGLGAADRAQFLRARFLADEDGYNGLMTASATFEALLVKYPDNLPVIMATAEANLETFEVGIFSKERLARAEVLTRIALARELPPEERGGARATLAQIHFLKDLDIKSAEAGFADAFVLSPQNQKARSRYARLLQVSGRFEAAIREFAAVAGQYDDDAARLEIWRTHYYAGRYDIAIAGAVELSENAQRSSAAMLLVASAHEAKGDFKKAYVWLKKAYGQRNYQNDFMDQLEAAVKADGPAGYYGLMLGYMLKAEANGASLSPARLAGLALAAEDIETAETYITKALEARDPGLYTLRLSPFFKAYAKANPEQNLAIRIGAVAKS